MARPVIALLTDFGMRDHYVGTMKGVMLGICPEATFVDISHDVPPILGDVCDIASPQGPQLSHASTRIASATLAGCRDRPDRKATRIGTRVISPRTMASNPSKYAAEGCFASTSDPERTPE